MIYKKSKQTMNFRVSLSKEQSTLLEKTHINNIGGLKFHFSDANCNLKVKFDNNKNISFDSIQSLPLSIEEKLGNDGIYEHLQLERQQLSTIMVYFFCLLYPECGMPTPGIEN